MDLSELYHKKSSFAARNVGTEIILVPVKNSVADMNELFTLNEVGSFIWNHIDGEKSENDIVKALIVDFNVDEERAIKDVKEFIESLKALIEKS
ncbi:MAG: PqqD family protein [Bacteroidota bacterium]